MSNITTTIAKLQKNFEAWHEDNYGILHKKTTDCIIEQIEQFKSENSNTTGAILAQITTIGQFLAKSIDGNDGNITSIDNISNVLHNKNHIFDTGNLSSLDTRTTNNTNKIREIQGRLNDFVTVSTVESLINLNGMKVIDIPSGKNLNNYINFGFYKSIDSTVTNTIKNKPTELSEPFVLIVIGANTDNDSNNIKQILLTIDTNRIFIRSGIRSTWDTAWQELYTTKNTSTIDMEVEFETGDEPITYTLLKK